MRYLLLFWILLMQLNASTQGLPFNPSSTIYLVRHAEKLPGNDPLLTAAGNKRAGDLAQTLKDKGIQRIYVTGYKRTQHTGDSLRIQFGIDTVHYLADTSCADLLNKIQLKGDWGKPILIIGHSNTVPLMIGKLGIAGYPRDYIPDSEYDNLFILTYPGGKAVLAKEKFGDASSPAAKMQ